jgi:hypothetical protein
VQSASPVPIEGRRAGTALRDRLRTSRCVLERFHVGSACRCADYRRFFRASKWLGSPIAVGRKSTQSSQLRHMLLIYFAQKKNPACISHFRYPGLSKAVQLQRYNLRWKSSDGERRPAPSNCQIGALLKQALDRVLRFLGATKLDQGNCFAAKCKDASRELMQGPIRPFQSLAV